MRDYYTVSKDGHETITCEDRAGAFEAYDCLGRRGVVVKVHFFDTDRYGNIYEYTWAFGSMRRRTMKDGTIRYYMRDQITPFSERKLYALAADRVIKS